MWSELLHLSNFRLEPLFSRGKKKPQTHGRAKFYIQFQGTQTRRSSS